MDNWYRRALRSESNSILVKLVSLDWHSYLYERKKDSQMATIPKTTIHVLCKHILKVIETIHKKWPETIGIWLSKDLHETKHVYV